MDLSINDIKRMFSNPMYCLKEVEGWKINGEPLVDKKTWIRAAAKAIKEMGAEEWLENLLKNLEGEYYGIDKDNS